MPKVVMAEVEDSDECGYPGVGRMIEGLSERRDLTEIFEERFDVPILALIYLLTPESPKALTPPVDSVGIGFHEKPAGQQVWLLKHEWFIVKPSGRGEEEVGKGQGAREQVLWHWMRRVKKRVQFHPTQHLARLGFRSWTLGWRGGEVERQGAGGGKEVWDGCSRVIIRNRSPGFPLRRRQISRLSLTKHTEIDFPVAVHHAVQGKMGMLAGNPVFFYSSLPTLAMVGGLGSRSFARLPHSIAGIVRNARLEIRSRSMEIR
ncbi:hypothetical protein BDK51DRAFT_32596 [Blyttiomyces helicus]|uniref:Uncharacterized protein n=1 Tax=Blyttiomyces helicus TaxID=388810 RepID=A0A4P9VWE9_9FUNG|nr:hypothetical protein BDK51DRAFT_32596 [Blyttiomyces helicus]|eukprot:RKO83175.1 hypothetical protein BDK51DRAFT_32596 [Blyttiomyces helicus]